MSETASKADIVANKLAISLAKSQRLVESWLPPRTAEELANAKTEEEIEREEQELFTPVPEFLGLGAPLPKEIGEADSRRKQSSANDQLRRRILGTNSKKLPKQSPEEHKFNVGGGRAKSKPRLEDARHAFTSDDENEGGRSSLGSLKRKRVVPPETALENAAEVETSCLDGTKFYGPQPSNPMKGANNYLDEVLAQKSNKKKKKKKKKKHSLEHGQVG